MVPKRQKVVTLCVCGAPVWLAVGEGSVSLLQDWEIQKTSFLCVVVQKTLAATYESRAYAFSKIRLREQTVAPPRANVVANPRTHVDFAVKLPMQYSLFFKVKHGTSKEFFYFPLGEVFRRKVRRAGVKSLSVNVCPPGRVFIGLKSPD